MSDSASLASDLLLVRETLVLAEMVRGEGELPALPAFERLAQRLAEAEGEIEARKAEREDLVAEVHAQLTFATSERDRALAAEARANRAEEALGWLADWNQHGGYVVASTNTVTLPFEAVEVARAVVDPLRRAALTPTEEPLGYIDHDGTKVPIRDRPTEEPEPGSPEYEAQTDAFLRAIGVEEPEHG